MAFLNTKSLAAKMLAFFCFKSMTVSVFNQNINAFLHQNILIFPTYCCSLLWESGLKEHSDGPGTSMGRGMWWEQSSQGKCRYSSENQMKRHYRSVKTGFLNTWGNHKPKSLGDFTKRYWNASRKERKNTKPLNTSPPHLPSDEVTYK